MRKVSLFALIAVAFPVALACAAPACSSTESESAVSSESTTATTSTSASSTSTSATTTSSATGAGGTGAGGIEAGGAATTGSAGAGGTAGTGGLAGAGGAGATAGAGGTGMVGAGGGGGATCALCSQAFDSISPADPSTLCTNNGGPESSKQYFNDFKQCCSQNCGVSCDCNAPGDVQPQLCITCRQQYCASELIACGMCQPCSTVANGSFLPMYLCTAGSSPTSKDLYGALAACACNGACATDCASACDGSSMPSAACQSCWQTNCSSQLSACEADTTPHSG